jgi:hypothetical protein
VVPIFTEAEENPDLPELIGSGILLRVENRFFLLTAAHVLEAKKSNNSILVPIRPGKMVIIEGQGMTSRPPNCDLTVHGSN